MSLLFQVRHGVHSHKSFLMGKAGLLALKGSVDCLCSLYEEYSLHKILVFNALNLNGQHGKCPTNENCIVSEVPALTRR